MCHVQSLEKGFYLGTPSSFDCDFTQMAFFFSNASQGDDAYIIWSITNCMKHYATQNIKKKKWL
jgi:hypothetical protein